ncbi:HK97 gp10 family phage protein [Streptomyces sp. NPDC059853]|uniref:HK97 gp10 family phage protein n=1 Tax=Streptomyces TaxID=1883 RepID=UPI003658E70D
MSSRVRVDLDEAAIARDLGVDGRVGDLVRQVTADVAAAAQRRAPVVNGQLRASIRTSVTGTGTEVRGEVYTPLEYARYVHEGTGIYGPARRPIRPVRAKALSWRGPGGRRVFAAEVRGQRPNPFLLDALMEASPWPVTRGS